MPIIFISLGILIIAAIIASRRRPLSVRGHWQTFIDEFQLPSKEFYDAVADGLSERQIPQIAIRERSFLERHILSAKRVYLRVSQSEYVYYICAAPYGTGTFLSSWFCVKDESFLNRLPVISKLAGKDRSNKTLYQMDTEAMFRAAVHAIVLNTVNSLSEAKGIRGLTELEGQFNMTR